MPPSLEGWLPEGHLARFANDVVGELDLREIYADYEADGRGMAAYHRQMIRKVLFSGYCLRKASSRKLEQAPYNDVAVRHRARTSIRITTRSRGFGGGIWQALAQLLDRQFLLRGLQKVTPEWQIICTTDPLLKLDRFGGARNTAAEAAKA